MDQQSSSPQPTNSLPPEPQVTPASLQPQPPAQVAQPAQPQVVAPAPQPAPQPAQSQVATPATQPTPVQPIVQPAPVQPVAQATPQPAAPITPAPDSLENTAAYDVPARGSFASAAPTQTVPIPPPSHGIHTGGTKTRKVGFLKPALIALAALFLLGGGVAATYVGVILPNRPDNVVAIALSRLLASDELGIDTSTTYKFEETTTQDTIELTFDSNIDTRDNSMKAYIGLRDIMVSTSSSQALIDPDILDGIDVNAQILFNADSTSLYVKAGGLSSVVDSAFESSALDSLDSSERERVLTLYKDIVSIVEADWIQFEAPDDPSEISGPLDELTACTDKAGETLDFERILGETYIENRFFVVKNDFGKVDIMDDSMSHYEMTFTADLFRNFANSVLDSLFVNQEVEACLNELSGGDMRADLEEALKELGDYDFDVWIDGGKNLRRVSFVIEEDTQKLTVTTDLNLRDPQSIEFPESFKTADQLEQEVSDIFDRYYEAETSPVNTSVQSSSNNFDERITEANASADAALKLDLAEAVTILRDYKTTNGEYPTSTTSSGWVAYEVLFREQVRASQAPVILFSDDEPFFSGDVQYVFGAICGSDNKPQAGGSGFAMMTKLSDGSFYCLDSL